MKKFAFAAVVVAVLGCSQVYGMWAYTDPQILVDQADYVVLGKICDVNKKTGEANIQVETAYKGEKVDKIPVKFAPAPEGGLMLSDRISYGEGTEAVWILAEADDKGRYDLSYPLRKMSLEQLEEAKQLVENTKSLVWSEPVNGLSATLRPIKSVTRDKSLSYDLYLAVRNEGDEPVKVQVCSRDLKLCFAVKGPEGKRMMELPDYPNMTAKTLTLKKGQVAFVGFGWPAGLPTGPLKDGGEYTVIGTYGFTPDKDVEKPEQIWSGTIETKPVMLVTKEEK